MSGVHLVMSGGTGGGIVTPLGSIALEDIRVTTATASITVNTDGSISLNHGSGPSNWYSPSVAGIGSSYWVRLHVNSGSAPSSGSGTETWLQLTGLRSWSWSVTNATRFGNYYLQFSTAGSDATIVSTSTVTLDIESGTT